MKMLDVIFGHINGSDTHAVAIKAIDTVNRRSFPASAVTDIKDPLRRQKIDRVGHHHHAYVLLPEIE